VLLSVNDQELVPPAATPFRLGESYTLTVRKPDGSTTRSILAIPGSREKKRPIVVPDQVVSARKLDSAVGYIRVSMFPGVLGMDVARDISRAVTELGCDRLVVDLRGNTGGGIGCLRLMSHLCADRRGVGYSVGRKLARSGSPIASVVEHVLTDPYFASPPPKSTGRELFDPTFISAFTDHCRRDKPGASAGDIVATAVALTAASIADAFRRFVPEPVDELVVSGGGAENPALVDAIAVALPNVAVKRFSDLFFDGEAKEAVAFALLGYLHLMGEPGNLPSVTGARGPRILGQLTPA
jgi:hypothetical protein